MPPGAIVGSATALVSVVGALLSKVESHVTAVEETAVLLLVGLLGGFGRGKVDVAEPTRSTSVPIGDDTGAEQIARSLELLKESIVVNVPGEVADEESSRLVRLVGLGLLGLTLLLDVGGGLPLLARSFGLSLSLFGSRPRLRLGVVGVGCGVVRVGLGLVRVFRLGSRLKKQSPLDILRRASAETDVYLRWNQTRP